MPRSYHVLYVYRLGADSSSRFLLERGQTDRHTDATERSTPLFLSSVACPLMKCCRVDDASTECTVTGFSPG